LKKTGTPYVDGLYYKTNKMDNWEKYIIDTTIVLDRKDDYVQFRNSNNKLSYYQNYVKFYLGEVDE